MRYFKALTLSFALALALPPAPALAQAPAGNFALILSAEEYARYKPSEIGAARAQEIATLLNSRGFDVSSVTNPTNAAARAALRDFSAKIAGARLALVIVMGHGVSTSGQTFFLPGNAEIERGTDLLSRGLSVSNVAQIIAPAKAGGLCFLMTSPNFPSPVDGVDFRPVATLAVPANVAIGVSNSPKIPLSRSDISAAQSAKDVAALLQSQPNADLKQFLTACSAQNQGTLIGTAADVTLTRPAAAAKPKPEVVTAPPPPPPAPAATPPPVSEDMVQTLQALEGMLDPRQVRRVQTKLTSLGLYQGPIDAIIGPLTRIAIQDYQKRTGQAETGYLTPAQLRTLVEGVP